MVLKIHNTLTGKKEKFSAVDGKRVNIYVCGITPYDESHLGHARCYVIFDVIYRYLKYAGYDVNYVQNFTDIDDKIINRANEINKSPKDIAEKYIADFKAKMRLLNVKDASEYPRVSGHIKEIIDFVSRLIKKGVAYVEDGDVYFSVRKFPGYGKLSRRDLEQLKVGARIAPGEKKKDPLDFALWKKSKDSEPEEVKFD